MMKLDSCKKKQLYEYSFYQIYVKKYSKANYVIQTEKYWDSHERRKWSELFCGWRHRKEKCTLQREEVEAPEPPLR